MIELSRRDARRIAVRAQMLTADRPASLINVVRGLTLLQIDATNSVAPNADLVVWSRLGSAYCREELEVTRDQGLLLEVQGMIRPAEDVALYRADMAAWPGGGDEPKPWQVANGRWVEANDGFRRDILDHIEAAGPSLASELPDTCVTAWKSSGWNNDRNVGQMVDMMEARGEIAVAGRRRGKCLWDLSSRVFPDDPIVPSGEALITRNELRLHSLGLARAKGPACPVEPQGVGDAGQPAVIEGVRGQWRVDPAYLDGVAFEGRTTLLSPLDRTIFDRKRMVEIFDFDYALEMYKSKAKRRWGYFALPILHGDRFVGKVDCTADRKSGVLRVDAVHEDEAFTRTLRSAVDHEIDDLAAWLELDL
ncbi:MAG: crosslink repair DNA glycosylase YcaQ family protein [Ornithinimicrobium sp.]